MDLQRVFAQFLVGVEAEGHVPKTDPHQSDDKNRHAPHQQFKDPVRLPVRAIFARRLASTIPPQNPRCGDQDGNHRDQSQKRYKFEMSQLLRRHRPHRLQKRFRNG